MEKEIIFLNVGSGKKKENNEPYYYIEYVKTDGSFKPKRDYIEQNQYEILLKKTKGKEMQKITGILGANRYDRLVVVDIK